LLSEIKTFEEERRWESRVRIWGMVVWSGISSWLFG
jgi:hypothetical protein